MVVMSENCVMCNHYVYMLECSDGSLYTGYTTNVGKRLDTHNRGKGAKFTRSRLPCKLVYVEVYTSKQEAMSRGWHIKHKLSRKDKLQLIQTYEYSISR
nr:MAG TPA: GIY-YIG nuclease superfamily protein [Caudoviricetes sp.]